jgi:hypothetical protein
MKWLNTESYDEWCLRACETDDKAVIAEVLRSVETIVENYKRQNWAGATRGMSNAYSGRDLLLSKLRLLEDQETNE